MTTSSAPSYCAPCLADLALVREAVTAVSGTAACMAHAVLLTHPGDTAQRRLQRLSELRGLAEGKLETASTEDQPALELLVQEYALAGAMDMTVPLRELAGERTRPGRPERGRNRPGRGDREHRPDGDGGERSERGDRPERGERPERGPRGERGGRGRGDRGPRPSEGTATGAPSDEGAPVAAASGDGTSPTDTPGSATPFAGDAGVTQSPGEAADAQIAPSTPQPADSAPSSPSQPADSAPSSPSQPADSAPSSPSQPADSAPSSPSQPADSAPAPLPAAEPAANE